MADGKHYQEGYRNGAADRRLGLPASIIAMTAEGYKAGYNANPRRNLEDHSQG
jgi:hypothetical protein